jgi:hypothetical protein
MIATLLLLAQAAPTASPPGPPPLPPATLVAEPVALAIAGFDADGDARVTRAELAAGVKRSFASVAGSADTLGYIAFADWAERYLGNRSALPSPFETDANGDNRIGLAELEAKFAEVFARLDADKDGVLTRAELLTIRADAGRAPDKKRRK